MNVLVRLAKPDDAMAVFHLLGQLWPDKALSENEVEDVFHQGLSSATETYVIATRVDRVIGFASMSMQHSLYHGGKLAWVEALVSDHDARNNGVGGALMDAVVELAINQECKALEIMIDNQAHAVKFVKNKGFQLRGNTFELKLTVPRESLNKFS